MSYKDLIVWNKSMLLVKTTYKFCSFLPKEEIYGLTQQMKRSAVSIPSNIAERKGRRTDRQSIQFYRIASGSLSELTTQIIIAYDLYKETNKVINEYYEELMKMTDEVGKMLYSLEKSLIEKNVSEACRLSAEG